MSKSRCTITIGPINLRMLKHQKSVLVELLHDQAVGQRLSRREEKALNGIKHLLDHVQDTAERFA